MHRQQFLAANFYELCNISEETCRQGFIGQKLHLQVRYCTTSLLPLDHYSKGTMSPQLENRLVSTAAERRLITHPESSSAASFVGGKNAAGSTSALANVQTPTGPFRGSNEQVPPPSTHLGDVHDFDGRQLSRLDMSTLRGKSKRERGMRRESQVRSPWGFFMSLGGENRISTLKNEKKQQH